MKKILLCLLVSISAWIAQGCMPTPTTSNKRYNLYTYKVRLQNGVKDSINYYLDDVISVKFKFNNQALSFGIQNLTSEPLKIKWDESSLVILGESQKIIHSGTKLINATEAQVPTVIPPKAFITESVVPSGSVKYSTYAGWMQNTVFPKSDNGRAENEQLVKSLIGKGFSLYMPIARKGEQIDYNFEFIIVDISSKVETVF